MSETTPKTVLVTGGNRGIGYEIAKEFKAAGHNVCVTYRSGDAPEEFFAVKADVRDSSSITEAFKTIEEQFGRYPGVSYKIPRNELRWASPVPVKAPAAEVEELVT